MDFIRTASTGNIPDETLLDSYRRTANTEYLGRLYDRYIPLVYGMSLKYLQDADEAQDAVMSLFEILIDKVLHQDIRNLRAWLYTVTRNHCLQIIREKGRENQVEIRLDVMDSDEVLYLFEEESDERCLRALQECMKKLPEHQRISIWRFFMDQHSYAEIAEDTGYSLSRVKSYIQNGKRNLKICIERTA